MDTIVIATGMPFFLAFLDQQINEVVRLWESWVDSGELVQVRYEGSQRDPVIRLRPAVLGTVEFVPNEPAGRLFQDRVLYTLPTLITAGQSADFAPQHSHYWTLQMKGFTATPEPMADGRTGLVLGHWELGRL